MHRCQTYLFLLALAGLLPLGSILCEVRSFLHLAAGLRVIENSGRLGLDTHTTPLSGSRELALVLRVDLDLGLTFLCHVLLLEQHNYTPPEEHLSDDRIFPEILGLLR